MEIHKCNIHVHENSSTMRIHLMCVFSVWSGPNEPDVFHLCPPHMLSSTAWATPQSAEDGIQEP